MAVIVRWRWASDDSETIKVESFPSVAEAKRWIKGFIRSKRRPAGEDHPILIDTSFDRESSPIRLSTKDPSDMSAAKINRELDRIEEVDGARESNPARREIKLWRYDPITGYWRVAQGPFDDAKVAEQYLAIFRKDEPGITFKLSAKRPPYPKSSRESNPARSLKDPETMSAAEINREFDRISAEDSKVNQELIDAGRGHEKYWDILKKDDPLSRRALALMSRRHKLKIEIERRAGPGMSRLPRGFGPRKSNPVKKRANDLTAEAMEGYTGAPLKYLYSSPSWYAYKIGEYFRASGRPEPSDVRMGRGYSINVRDMTFTFGKNDAITRVK